MTEQMESEVENMCNLSDGVFNAGEKRGMKKGIKKGRKKGRKEGRKEKLVEDISSIMKKYGCCESEAMDTLNVSSELRPEISSRLHASFN